MTTMLMKMAALSYIFMYLPTSLKCTKKHTHTAVQPKSTKESNLKMKNDLRGKEKMRKTNEKN
jgi:hypothetical protein